MKTCKVCGVLQAEDCFYVSKNKYRDSTCKDCRKSRVRELAQTPEAKAKRRAKYNPEQSAARQRNWKQANPDQWAAHQYKSHIKRRYGLTLEQLDALLALQGGRCAICCDVLADMHRKFHIDHVDSADGPIVRGILCYRCNPAIALFRDNPDVMLAAITYVQAFRNAFGPLEAIR